MKKIMEVKERTPELINKLLEVWEGSVSMPRQCMETERIREWRISLRLRKWRESIKESSDIPGISKSFPA